MKRTVLTTILALVAGAAVAQPAATPRLSGSLQQKIAPGMAAYTDEVLFGQVWPGAGLSPRDRSLVVISALIATNKPAQLQGHLGRALNNGVTPVEASGVLTHLAVYSGWPNAVSALEVYDSVYTARKIDFAQLQAVAPRLPPLAGDNGVAAPAFAETFARLNRQVVADDLWRRGDLSLRDRSLVTIAALTAMGEADQLPGYLRRGAEAGLTGGQIGEAMTHLAFYAGWPRATQALQIANQTLAPVAVAASTGAPASASNFKGDVSVTQSFRGTGAARLGGGRVSFAPGARTKWHSHPLGQLVVVTAGQGWMQSEGEPARALKPGDIVWTPPNVKHWHGGTRNSGMEHVAVSESHPDQAVQWYHAVSEAEFQGP
jgi:4-carboxymuconolactone decarboxylase